MYKTLHSGEYFMRSGKNTRPRLFSAQVSWIHPSFGRYTLTPPGDSPCARVGHSCSYLPPVGDAKRGKVFIVGGADPSRSFSDVHTMDLGKTSSCGARALWPESRTCATGHDQTIRKNTGWDQRAGFSSKKMNVTERPLTSQQTSTNQYLILGGERVSIEPRTSNHCFIRYFSGRYWWLHLLFHPHNSLITKP